MRHAVSFSLWRSVHPQDNPQTGLEFEEHFLRFIHTECEWHGFSKGAHSYSHWVKAYTYWKPNKFSVEGVFVELQNLLYRVNSIYKNICVDHKTRNVSIPSFDISKSHISNDMSNFCNRLIGYPRRGHCWLSSCINMDTVISNFMPSGSSSCGTMCQSRNIDLY